MERVELGACQFLLMAWSEQIGATGRLDEQRAAGKNREWRILVVPASRPVEPAAETQLLPRA